MWLSLRGRPQLADGRVTSILGAASDITARKEAEARIDEHQRSLEQLSTELETIIDAVPGLVFYKDTANRFMRVNRYLADAYGMTKRELEGTSLYQLHDQEQAQAYHDDDLEVIRSGQAKLNIDEPWSTDAGLRWVVTNKMPVCGEDGEIKGVIGISLDITARKRAEEAREEYARKLEASNQELDAFAYSVSHDLRSPLRAIDGYSRILLEDHREALDEDGRHMLEEVRAGAQEMGLLIDGLLAFSRLGRREVDKESVDVTEVARRVFTELEVTHPDRRLQLELGELPPAAADPVLLLEVLRNLLGNAVKFTATRATAKVAMWGESSDTETVYHVRDNGVGFDMQYVDKLFKVFQRLHGREEFEGTGIGLALVERIVRRHGGRVWAEAAVGRGATVSFSLPAINDIKE